MDSIIGSLQALKDDKPWIYITDKDIKECIEIYIDELIKEIREEL